MALCWAANLALPHQEAVAALRWYDDSVTSTWDGKALSFLSNTRKFPTWCLLPPFYFLVNARTVLLQSERCVCAVITLKMTAPDVHIPMSVLPSQHWLLGDWILLPTMLTQRSSVTTFPVPLFWRCLHSQFTNHSKKLGAFSQWHLLFKTSSDNIQLLQPPY